MTVTVLINGKAYMLTYNAETGLYQGEISAPDTPAVYDVAVTANNGNTAYTELVKLDVRRELTPPVTKITRPVQGEYVQDAATAIQFSVMDEADGSGIDLSTLSVELAGRIYIAEHMTCTARDNGYDCVLIPQGVSDGKQP